MEEICQNTLPFAPWLHPATRRLPGIQPLAMDDWLIRDEVFASQMALRDRLLKTRRDDVFRALPEADLPARELLNLVLSRLGPDYPRDGQIVTRPDGVTVDLDSDHPLIVAARLVQEDLCLLDQANGGDEHILTGAVLCFPASWTLAEKIGHPMTRIHVPVEEYTANMAARVQRLFDALHVDRPLWRANALLYHDPSLHQARRENDRRIAPKGRAEYLRSERQSLLRLPETRAVVFSIHTWVVPWVRLNNEQRAGLDIHPIETAGQGA
ncbi:heme-dependent oxidative N-demethylase family protein [Nioella aestuarii]|uniref:heme-dependent oxidative N-demethylase family protein n=1 Tax=Nioella aestuarii TaxID=1662864 RepID=UPI003D7FC12C